MHIDHILARRSSSTRALNMFQTHGAAFQEVAQSTTVADLTHAQWSYVKAEERVQVQFWSMFGSGLGPDLVRFRFWSGSGSGPGPVRVRFRFWSGSGSGPVPSS